MAIPTSAPPRPVEVHVEDVEVRGHIIDSLILPKILDCITSGGGAFRIKEITIGQARTDPSYALSRSARPTRGLWSGSWRRSPITGPCRQCGLDCRLAAADIARAFPEGFYSTTNQRTEVRLAGQWMPVEDQEMDCGIVVDAARGRARCLPMNEVGVGDAIVVGQAGVRVFPEERSREHADVRVHGQHRLDREAQGAGHPADRPGAGREPRRGRQDPGGGRPGRRPHRQRRVPAADDPHGLRRRALRRQRPGHARHRAGPVRHQPGRVSRSRASRPRRATSTTCGRSTASAAPAASARRSSKAYCDRGSCTSASAAGPISCWPAASATTARCPK